MSTLQITKKPKKSLPASTFASMQLQKSAALVTFTNIRQRSFPKITKFTQALLRRVFKRKSKEWFLFLLQWFLNQQRLFLLKKATLKKFRRLLLPTDFLN